MKINLKAPLIITFWQLMTAIISGAIFGASIAFAVSDFGHNVITYIVMIIGYFLVMYIVRKVTMPLHRR